MTIGGSLEFGGVGGTISAYGKRSGGMKSRIAIWAGAGALVVVFHYRTPPPKPWGLARRRVGSHWSDMPDFASRTLPGDLLLRPDRECSDVCVGGCFSGDCAAVLSNSINRTQSCRQLFKRGLVLSLQMVPYSARRQRAGPKGRTNPHRLRGLKPPAPSETGDFQLFLKKARAGFWWRCFVVILVVLLSISRRCLRRAAFQAPTGRRCGGLRRRHRPTLPVLTRNERGRYCPWRWLRCGGGRGNRRGVRESR